MPKGWLDIDHSARELGIDVDLLSAIIEAVKSQSIDDNLTNREFAETVANVYAETIDEPVETRNSSYFQRLINKLTSILLKGLNK